MDNMMSQQDQGQEYAQPQPQQNSPQGSISPANGDEKATTGAEVEYQTQQLWYWVEIAKPFAFHNSNLPLATASHLSEIYLSRLPPTNDILPTAHTAITLTLLSTSHLLLRYLILGVLFPLLRQWSTNPTFHAFITHCTRAQRLAFWREKALTTPGVLDRYLEVLDTMLDRKWVYRGDDRGDMAARDLRSKMQLYLLWKFVLSADEVFMELVMRLDYEPYNRERFHEVYYPAMLPKMMAINRDPSIVPFLVEPRQWPSKSLVEEEVLNRCLALIGRRLE
ncbi:hypothetical protein BKA61DRAFT_72845 [Leptodontidium sp. MPI-SDFR-AT-0119]|nr:hypothetical protein BKA61DRAFT_72845 [Leptodontidium sp. MPI-SDFR-AT-0119]